MIDYNDLGLFDNEIVEENDERSPFSLEAIIRCAAQRMIAADLDAEAGGVFTTSAGRENQFGR